MSDDNTPKTLTLTYFCGHKQEIENTCDAETRIEFLRHFNCPNCHADTDKLHTGDPTKRYYGPAYHPQTPTRRPFLSPDYLRLPKPSIAQEIDLFTQQTTDPKKLN